MVQATGVEANRPAGRFKTTTLSIWVIVLFVVAAWLPMLRAYPLFSDDFPLSEFVAHGFSNYVHTFVPAEGLWRFLQQPMVRLTTVYSPYEFPVVALVAHILAAICFYLSVLRFTHQRSLSLAGTLIVFVFPWCFTAVLWASAFGNVLCTLSFWFCFYLMLTTRRKWRWVSAIVLFVLPLLTLFTQENLVFVFMGVGFLAIVPPGLKWGRQPMARLKARSIHRFYCFVPVLSSLIYICCYMTIKGNKPVKKLKIHLATLIAVPARQYTNFQVFRAWLSRVCIHEAAAVLPPLLVGFAILAAVIGCIVFWKVSARSNRANVRSGGLAIALCTLALFGLAAAFVMAGGYTEDSRKKYEILPVGMLWVVLVISRLNLQGAFAVLIKRAGIAVMLLGITTTWLVCGVYIGESYRADRLFQAVAASGSKHPLVTYDPDVYRAWPTYVRLSFAGRMDEYWIMGQYLTAHGRPVVEDMSLEQTPQSDFEFTVSKDAVVVRQIKPTATTWP